MLTVFILVPLTSLHISRKEEKLKDGASEIGSAEKKSRPNQVCSYFCTSNASLFLNVKKLGFKVEVVEFLKK